jgi:hypothetical protein
MHWIGVQRLKSVSERVLRPIRIRDYFQSSNFTNKGPEDSRVLTTVWFVNPRVISLFSQVYCTCIALIVLRVKST